MKSAKCDNVGPAEDSPTSVVGPIPQQDAEAGASESNGTKPGVAEPFYEVTVNQKISSYTWSKIM